VTHAKTLFASFLTRSRSEGKRNIKDELVYYRLLFTSSTIDCIYRTLSNEIISIFTEVRSARSQSPGLKGRNLALFRSEWKFCDDTIYHAERIKARPCVAYFPFGA